jgi:hypothetical protein
MKNILVLNNPTKKCGISQLGIRSFDLIKAASPHNVIYLATDNVDTLKKHIEENNIDAVIANYFISTMSWSDEFVRNLTIPKVCIFHDAVSTLKHCSEVYDAVVFIKPNFKERDNILAGVRPIRRFEDKNYSTEEFTIGTHGLCVSSWKRYHEILTVCAKEYPKAKYKFNLVPAELGDINGEITRSTAEYCMKIASMFKLDLEITHHFFEAESDLIDWLAKNDLNIYLSIGNNDNGPAASADLGISAQKPIVVNKDRMYEHFFPYISNYPDSTLKELYEKNKTAVKDLYHVWDENKYYESFVRAFKIAGLEL